MIKAFWIAYDLGLKGDYNGLYTWLDTISAKECGDSLAYFTKECKDDSIEEIKKEIKKYVKLNKTDRIYLIYKDSITNKVKGVFLFGGRKRAPWQGYAESIETIDEDLT